MLYRACSALAVMALGTLGAVACGDNARSAATDAATPDTPTIDAAMIDVPPPGIDFTETYAASTADVGNWILTTNAGRARSIELAGGDPDGYLRGEVSTAIPTWATASTRFQPGVNDDSKRDSVFVGDYYANHVQHISADLQIYQFTSWRDRTVTLHLMSWDVAKNEVAFDAFFSLPDIVDVPTGWNHYDVQVDARSATVPPGWDFTRGDGTPGTDADWATFMHQIDLVGFGLWKPHTGYPGLNSWQLGIDNIHIGS